jgi:dGTP triphosphohydrolase
MLDNAIKMDKEHFKGLGVNLKDQKRTITCQIMDEADRNSYVCSDLADFFCLGNSVSLKEIRTFAKGKRFDLECSELSVLADLVRSNSKTAIKAYFNTLKNRFNFNYTITDSGLNVSNQDLDDYREFLYAFEVKFFIKPTMKTEKHESNLKALEYYIDYVHHMEYYPSKTYKALIEGAKNSQEALTHMRDMIAETTDWYVIDFKPSGLQV